MIDLRRRGVRHLPVLAWPVFAWTFVASETLLILALSSSFPPPGAPPGFAAAARPAIVGEPGVHPGAIELLARVNLLVAIGLWVAARAARRPRSGGLPVIAAALAAGLVLLGLSVALLRWGTSLSPPAVERSWELQPDGGYLERELNAPLAIAPESAPAPGRPRTPPLN